MTTRERILTVLLGIAGIVAAGAITLAANSISGDEIGLSAQPVSLAASEARPKPAPAAKAEDREDRSGPDDELEDGSDDSGPGSSDDGAPSSGSRGGGDDRGGDRDHPSGTSGISGSSGSGSGTTTVEDEPEHEPEEEDHSGPGS